MKKIMYTTDLINSKNILVYDDFDLCIINEANRICSNCLINSKLGYFYNTTLDSKNYILIERYEGQFERLKRNLNINVFRNNSIDFNFSNFKTIRNNGQFKNIIKIENLYKYLIDRSNLLEKRNKKIKFTIITNNDPRKKLYDIPSDNGDLIQEFFYLNENITNEKLMEFTNLLSDQKQIINDINQILKNINLEDKDNFIINLYSNETKQLNYDLINSKLEKKNLKKLIKRKIKMS